MTTLADGPSGPPAGAAVDIPTHAEGVQLLGAQPGSGYRTPPALVQRADGQVLQLTPLLYAVLEAIDGRRDREAIAAAVSTAVQRAVTATDV